MKLLVRCLALKLLSSAVAHSQTILFNNMFTPSDTTHGGLYVAGNTSLAPGRRDAAEQFQLTAPSSAFLTSAVVPFHAFSAAATMNGTATVFADASNTPGSILETTTWSGSLLNTSDTLVTVTFSGSTLLSPGTNYWLGFSMAPGPNWAQ